LTLRPTTRLPPHRPLVRRHSGSDRRAIRRLWDVADFEAASGSEIAIEHRFSVTPISVDEVPDPAYTRHCKLQLFIDEAGNAQERPWKYPGMAEARFRVLVQSRHAYLTRPLTRQKFFVVPITDQLST
jgi:hypothetical protein